MRDGTYIPPTTEELEETVKRFNEKYATADYGGRFVIFWEEPSIQFPGTWDFNYFKPYDFFGYENKKIVIDHRKDGSPKVQGEGEAWFEHRDRKTYKRIVFWPGQPRVIPQTQRPTDFPLYNLYRGFKYQPIAGDCSRYLEHLFENVCQGNDQHYRWLLRWMSYAVRHPDEPGHSAIVIRGRKGTGKTFAAQKFGELWGSHAMTVSNSRLLTGNFNRHLMDKLVLIADEAFFAGNRADDAMLKSLITGGTIVIEAKFFDAFTTPNFLHIFIISNNDKVVTATDDERRYFVLECGEKQRGKTAYFKAIQDQLDDGGYEALLDHLLNKVDLSNFDPRRVLDTPWLLEQIKQNLGGFPQLWHECLVYGELPGILDKRDGTFLLHGGNFVDWGKKKNPRAWSDLSARDAEEFFGKKGLNLEQRRGTTHDRRRFWVIPTLAECRALWDQQFRSPGDWPDDGGSWEEDRAFHNARLGA